MLADRMTNVPRAGRGHIHMHINDACRSNDHCARAARGQGDAQAEQGVNDAAVPGCAEAAGE